MDTDLIIYNMGNIVPYSRPELKPISEREVSTKYDVSVLLHSSSHLTLTHYSQNIRPSSPLRCPLSSHRCRTRNWCPRLTRLGFLCLPRKTIRVAQTRPRVRSRRARAPHTRDRERRVCQAHAQTSWAETREPNGRIKDLQSLIEDDGKPET